MLFGGGEWLIRDDGYNAKFTSYHNTLLINGKGQLDDGTQWFSGIEQYRLKAEPRITRAVSTLNLDHITGDATEVYPRDIGLVHYIRHLLFLKPDVLIVVDDIVLDKAQELELLFHPKQKKSEHDNNAFIMCGEKTVLRLDPLTDDGIGISSDCTIEEDASGVIGKDPLYTIHMKAKKAQWRNAVALSWARTDAEPSRITVHEDGDEWVFTDGKRTIVLNWTTGEAKIR